MRQRARQRTRISLLVILCLLFQQLALAAYACPLRQMPPEPAGMAAHCAEMGMQTAQDNPALCAKHCAPDIATPADSAKLSVPAVALPPPVFAPVLVPPPAHVASGPHRPLARVEPPPRLRFCSLLI